MSQTVIGIFKHLSEARSVEAELFEAGFNSSMVDISSRADGTSGQRDEVTDATQHEGPVERFFAGLLGSEAEANRYAGVADRNEALVTVHAATAEQAERAAAILDHAGAIDIEADAEQYGIARSSNTSAPNDTDESVQVIQENLQVGKRTVETGGTRLRSRIVEREVSEDIRLKHERVIVNRRPVDRVANAADLAAFRDGQIEIVEHAEVPVVTKEVRVVEEVSLKKEQGERTETVRDTVRSTEVEVEQIAATTPPSTDRR